MFLNLVLIKGLAKYKELCLIHSHAVNSELVQQCIALHGKALATSVEETFLASCLKKCDKLELHAVAQAQMRALMNSEGAVDQVNAIIMARLQKALAFK